MAEYLIQDTTLTNIAAPIKTLMGLTDNLTTDEMVSNLNDANTAVANALVALTDKGVEVPEGTKVDGLAALIEAIESGGEESFTFTPAETGLLPLDVEDYESIKAVFWYNTGNIQVGTTGEGIAGFSILNSDSVQQIVCLYNKGTYPSSLSADVYHSNSSFHHITVSSDIEYGASVLSKALGSAVTVYVNAESGRGLRVGATYKVIIQRV